MVDALDSKSGVSNGVRVRVSSPVNFFEQQLLVNQGVVFLGRGKGYTKRCTMAPSQGFSLPFAFLIVSALVSLGEAWNATLYLILVDPMD